MGRWCRGGRGWTSCRTGTIRCQGGRSSGWPWRGCCSTTQSGRRCFSSSFDLLKRCILPMICMILNASYSSLPPVQLNEGWIGGSTLVFSPCLSFPSGSRDKTQLLRWRHLSKGDVSSGCFARSGTIDAGYGLRLLRFILDG